MKKINIGIQTRIARLLGLTAAFCSVSGQSFAVKNASLKFNIPIEASQANLASLNAVSSKGTIYYRDVAESKMLPRGSALITSSGALKASGITAIIHAASGSMGDNGANFAPTLEGVKLAVKNSVLLAKKHGHSTVAVPFIGGMIFLDRIGVSADVLSDAIIQAALEEDLGLGIRFVTYSDSDTHTFVKSIGKTLKKQEFAHARGKAFVVQGSLTDFSLHGATAIVNAANMEVIFGGGLSGAIANATRTAAEIDAEAEALVTLFNQAVLKALD